MSIGEGTSGPSAARVRSIIWRSGREPNYAELVIDTRFEEFQGEANAPVRVSMNVAHAGGGADDVIFCGRITGRGAVYSPDSEQVVIVALGPRWDLTKDFINGQELDTYASGEESPTVRCITALPCVFNPGWGNRTTEIVTEDGAYAFTGDPRVLPDPARVWRATEMLQYTYRQRLRTNRREFADFGGAGENTNVMGDPVRNLVPAELANTVLWGIDVQGLDLAAGFDVVLSAAGYRWWLKPLGVGEGGPYGELRIARRQFDPDGTTGRVVGKTLYLPMVKSGALPGVAVSNPELGATLRQPNHNRGAINVDYSKVVSQVVAFGSPVKLQVEIQLAPGWRQVDENKLTIPILGGTGEEPTVESDRAQLQRIRVSTTESTAGDTWQPLGGLTADTDPEEGESEEGTRYSGDVGRVFLVNETGYEVDREDEAGEPITDPFDWAGADLGLTPEAFPIAPRPRPFHTELLRKVALGTTGDAAGVARRTWSAQLEVLPPVGLGEEFVPVPDGAWAVEPDRCGVRITDDNLLRRPFFNPKKPEEPEGGSGEIPAWMPFARAAKLTVVVETDWLVANKAGLVSAAGARAVVNAGADLIQTGATGEEVAARLGELATQKLNANSAPIVSASFSIPWITTAFEPGDWITKVAGREANIRGQVSEVRLEFESQDTHIQLEDCSLFVGGGGGGGGVE